MDGVLMNRGFSPQDKVRFDAIRSRADKLGVLDINFSGADSTDSLECYEYTLDIIEENKETLDRLAGVTVGV
jgi:hypothetical protein